MLNSETLSLFCVSDSAPRRSELASDADYHAVARAVESAELGPVEIVYSGNYDSTRLTGKVWELLRRCLKIEISHAVRVHDRQPPIVISAAEISAIPIEVMRMVCGGSFTHVAFVHKIDSGMKRHFQQHVHWLNKVDAVICTNELQAAYVKENCQVPAERVYVVPIGIDTDWFSPQPELEPERELETNHGPEPAKLPFMLSVGLEQRNYPLLIEAMRIIEQSGEHPDIRLVIFAGSRWSRQKSTKSLNLPQNVTLHTEFAPAAEIRSAYRAARLVVVPILSSPHAAGCNGLLEPLAVGSPTLVSRSPGLREYREPFTAASGDSTALYDMDCEISAFGLSVALIELWRTTPQLDSASRAATRQVVVKQFSHAEFAQRVAMIVKTAHTQRTGQAK